MKKIQSYIIAILAIGLVMVGCNKLEDYDSITVATEPVATIEVANVGDSAFTLTMGTDKAGYLGYVVLEDTSITPEAINVLAKSYEGDGETKGVGLSKMDEAGNVSVEVTGLIQNSYYKAFVAANNTEGAESKLVSFLVKTNDNYAPTFLSSSPAISNEAAVTIGERIVLTFDEPVMLGSGSFTVDYFHEGVSETIPLDSLSASGFNISIGLPHVGHAGDYFFISWEEGAITDLSGNKMDARTSGVLNNTLVGNYYRFEHENFNVSEATVTPSTDEPVADHMFVIDITFPYEVSLQDLAPSDIVLRYSNWLEEGYPAHEESAHNSCEIINDSTLRISQNYEAGEGDTISLYFAKGIIKDKYSNDIDMTEFELSWVLGDFVVPVAGITPATGSVLTSQTFNVEIKFPFPITTISDNPGEIVMTYTTESGSTDVPVTVYGVSGTDDSVLVIPSPQAAEFGTTVTLHIGENVVADPDGNVNLELMDVVSWSIPKLAANIDVLLGQYIVSGLSYYDDSEVTDTVTIALVEGYTDSVTVTGLFKSLLGGSDPVYGSYDAENSFLVIPEQVIGSGTDRYYTAFSNATASYAIENYVLEDGSMATPFLSLGVYDGSFAWLGFGEVVVEASWTKLAAPAINSGVTTKNNAVQRINFIRDTKGKK